MAGYMRIILLGNLTKDWELRYTDSGTAVGNNAIAINRKWKDGHGDQQEDVTFLNLTAWDKMAETLQKYQKKGDTAFFEGRLQEDKWEDKKSGEERRSLKVVVEGFQFISNGKPDSDSDRTARREQDRREEPRRREREDRPRRREREDEPRRRNRD